MIEVHYDTVEDISQLDAVCFELMSILKENLDRTPRDHPITYDIDNLFDLDSDVLEEFKNTIVVPAIEKYMRSAGDSLSNYNFSLKSWIAKYKDGRHIPSHTHPDSQISSIFYLLSEETNKGGEIVFTEDDASITYFPATGDVVIFPSTLAHHTLPFYGTMRISMPVDVFLKPKL
jgi:hypothetical protein